MSNTALAGRRVLVTGASSGIGAAIGRAVAAAGGQVAWLARRAERLEHEVASHGGVVVPADVTDPDAVVEAVGLAAESLGGLDGVVNAAGVLRPGDVGDTSPADWRQMVEVNVLGVLHVTHAALPHLRAAGADGPADVVMVSSMSGRRLASSGMGVYAATKAAVHTAAEGLRRELGPAGVRVCVLAPGLVDTDIFPTHGEVAVRLGEQARRIGLDPDRLGASVVHVLAAPPEVLHVEVALQPLAQT